jgi:hypothetical protein
MGLMSAGAAPLPVIVIGQLVLAVDRNPPDNIPRLEVGETRLGLNLMVRSQNSCCMALQAAS